MLYFIGMQMCFRLVNQVHILQVSVFCLHIYQISVYLQGKQHTHEKSVHWDVSIKTT